MNRKTLTVASICGVGVILAAGLAYASGSYVASPFKKKKVGDAAAEASPSPSPSALPSAAPAAASAPKGQAFKRK